MDDVALAAGITKLIIYRHFESKQTLYDEVLEQVADRLRGKFLTGIEAARPRSGAVEALLVTAREDPAGFRLLWRHASREPQFAEHADQIRLRGVRAAERLLEPVPFASPLVRRWAAATIVSYLVQSILHWLDDGDESSDEDVADLLSRSLASMITAWSVTPG
jgi:AcrR family transcriptional regulator